MKQDYLVRFNAAIDDDISCREWSESVAKKVKSRYRKKMIAHLCVILLGMGIVGSGLGLLLHKNDTAYNQFCSYVSDSAVYDYDILELKK